MKTLVLLSAYAIVSWVIGALICGILFRLRYKRATKITAIFFLFGPMVAYLYKIDQGRRIEQNFEKAKLEVQALCAKDGGDKIYKTVENVEGVFQMRARKDERQKDLRDQYGMVDPYGYTHGDGPDLADLVGYSGQIETDTYYIKFNGEHGFNGREIPFGKSGYWFVEQWNDNPQSQYPYKLTQLKYTGRTKESDYFFIKNNQKAIDLIYDINKNPSAKLKSRYGYITEDTTTKEMRDNWIGAGRIKIFDLQTHEVMAVRTGYFRASGDLLPSYADRWSKSYDCPVYSKSRSLRHFLHLVLRPPNGYPSKEQLNLISKE